VSSLSDELLRAISECVFSKESLEKIRDLARPEVRNYILEYYHGILPEDIYEQLFGYYERNILEVTNGKKPIKDGDREVEYYALIDDDLLFKSLVPAARDEVSLTREIIEQEYKEDLEKAYNILIESLRDLEDDVITQLVNEVDDLVEEQVAVQWVKLTAIFSGIIKMSASDFIF